VKTGTFAISTGKHKHFGFARFTDAWRLSIGRVTVTWMPIEFGEFESAWVDEVDDCDSMVEKRTSEVGVWN
jgi:hypothetical protein